MLHQLHHLLSLARFCYTNILSHVKDMAIFIVLANFLQCKGSWAWKIFLSRENLSSRLVCLIIIMRISEIALSCIIARAYRAICKYKINQSKLSKKLHNASNQLVRPTSVIFLMATPINCTPCAFCSCTQPTGKGHQ